MVGGFLENPKDSVPELFIHQFLYEFEFEGTKRGPNLFFKPLSREWQVL